MKFLKKLMQLYRILIYLNLKQVIESQGIFRLSQINMAD